MATNKRNESVRAMMNAMAKEKKYNANTLLEWEIACNTNSKRGKVYNQSELKVLYSNEFEIIFKKEGVKTGASKIVHTYNHNNQPFNHIVIKRHQIGGYIDEHKYDDTPMTGNQLIDEILTWEMYCDKEESDFFCPILKSFTSKSDKVNPTSEKAQDNVVIISQKASNIGDAWDACETAERKNIEEGFYGTPADVRFEEMKELSDRLEWRDVIRNNGNSGVIFDYYQQCYKAVFVDYGL